MLDGSEDGELDGTVDCDTLGLLDGPEMDGTAECETLGVPEGANEGLTEGAVLWESLGLPDGAEERVELGAPEGWTDACTPVGDPE